MARQFVVPSNGNCAGGFINETNAYEYSTPYGFMNESVAAAVGAFLARFGPIILQAVNRASTF